MSPLRVPAVLLSAWLMLFPSPPVRAGNPLPDEAAVRAFTETNDFSLNGWRRVQDAPSRRTPGDCGASSGGRIRPWSVREKPPDDCRGKTGRKTGAPAGGGTEESGGPRKNKIATGIH